MTVKSFLSLHAFDTYEGVICSLSNSECLNWSEEQKTRHESLVLNNLKTGRGTFLDVINTLRFLKKLKREKAKYYIIEYNNIISIYSDFFDASNITDIIVDWFIGSDYILTVDYTADYFEVAIYKGGSLLTKMLYQGTIETEFDYGILNSVLQINQYQIKQECAGEVDNAFSNMMKLFRLPNIKSLKEVAETKEYKVTQEEFTVAFYI